MNFQLIVSALMLALLCDSALARTVFTCDGENGKKVFQDKPCKGAIEEFIEQTADLTHGSLQGKWLITAVGDMSAEEMDVGDSYWSFEGDHWINIVGERRMRPDRYSLIGKHIDFGTYKVTVLEFTGRTMKVKALGLTYTLRKI